MGLIERRSIYMARLVSGSVRNWLLAAVVGSGFQFWGCSSDQEAPAEEPKATEGGEQPAPPPEAAPPSEAAPQGTITEEPPPPPAPEQPAAPAPSEPTGQGTFE